MKRFVRFCVLVLLSPLLVIAFGVALAWIRFGEWIGGERR